MRTTWLRELEPCPFCGRPVSKYNMEFIGTYIKHIDIDCQCGVHVEIDADYYYSNAAVEFANGDAIDIWNRRAAEDLSKEE